MIIMPRIQATDIAIRPTHQPMNMKYRYLTTKFVFFFCVIIVVSPACITVDPLSPS